VFDKSVPAASAITRVDDGPHPQAVALRALMRSLRCGTPATTPSSDDGTSRPQGKQDLLESGIPSRPMP
jgi:hypothetical protein